MESLFDQRVDRSGPISWLKDLFTPEAVQREDLLGFAGAEFEFPTCPAIAREHRVLVYSDEIFADVAFDGKQVMAYAAVAGEGDLAISCTALGKTFSLTGVNHANVLIKNPELRERFIQQRNADHYGSLDPFLHAALVAVYSAEGVEWLEEMKAYVRGNYRVFKAFIQERFPGAVVTEPEGTYVIWVDFAGTGMTGAELVRLISEEGLFVGDEGGEYYGRETCFRYCLAVPRKELIRSLTRLDAALKVRT